MGAVVGASKDAVMETGRRRPPNGAATRRPGASDSDRDATTACMRIAVRTANPPTRRAGEVISSDEKRIVRVILDHVEVTRQGRREAPPGAELAA